MTRRAYIVGGIGVIMLTFVVGMTNRTHAEIRTVISPDTASTIVAPLNGGPNTQQKLGSLLVGDATTAKKICLNTSDSTQASPKCISSWGQAITSSVEHVELSTGYVPTMTGEIISSAYPSSYDRQNGYVRLRAQSNQQVTAALRAPITNVCLDRFTGEPLSSQDEGFCASDPGRLCQVNSDCGFQGTALYGYATHGYAGYFGGTVYVRPATLGSYGTTSGRICLGGIESNLADATGGFCISSWNELNQSSPQYVQRQTANPPTAQLTGATIARSALFGSVIVGDSSITPVGLTCGNGICDALEQQSGSACPIDCATITGVQSFSVAPGVARTFLTGTIPTSGNAYILVVRKAGSAINGAPINGVNYIVGNIVGDGIVAAVLTNPAVGAWNYIDSGLTNGTKYYYAVYIANAYPNYSAAATSSATPNPATTRLTLSMVNATPIGSYSIGFSVVSGEGNTMTCVGSCNAFFTLGSVITLTRITEATPLTAWTGACSGRGATCTVTLDATKTVTATYSTNTGGGDDGGGLISD